MNDWLECDCGRGGYNPEQFSSCYNCFLDRREGYVSCIYCGAWHSDEFDTCYDCRPGGRDEAARDLKLVILGRDGFACRYCGIPEGESHVDPRLIRPPCPPGCSTEHNHRRPCRKGCKKRHSHRNPDDERCCKADCHAPHEHRAAADDGVRIARMHIDHILPCALGGLADPWNLQSLCAVCNIAKGADWIIGSRHYQARMLIMSAYMTYLSEWLDQDERKRLQSEASECGLTVPAARELLIDDYRRRVSA